VGRRDAVGIRDSSKRRSEGDRGSEGL